MLTDMLLLVVKIIACGAFGLAMALLVVAAYFFAKNSKLGTPLTVASTSMRRNEQRARARKKSFLFRAGEPYLRNFAAIVSGMDLEFLRAYVRVPYAQAGYPGGLDDDEVVTLGFMAGIGITLFTAFSIVVLLGFAWVWIALFGLPVGFLVVVSNLKTRAKIREVQILAALPYLLDLMTLMLRSGTSLRMALSRVVTDYEDHPLGVELGQVLAEIDVGAPRADAFRKLSNRLKIQDIDSFTDSIVQSEELGWPLAETLERLADRMSAERILRAQSTAGQAGVLVMIPSTLVLASAVLLMFGPMLVRWMRGEGML